MYFIALVLENLALSSDNNEDLIYCLKVILIKLIRIYSFFFFFWQTISECLHYRTSFQIIALEPNCSDKFIIERHRVNIEGHRHFAFSQNLKDYNFIGND